MNQSIKDDIAASIQNFKLPAYQEIPDVGFYLEQTTQYISEFLKPMPSISITSSMISNYVKKGLIEKPVKKQYHREQIAYLIFIAIAKTVLSLEDIYLLIQIQKQTYEPEIAYEYCCREFENILFFVFGLKDSLEEVGSKNSDAKNMLRNTIIAVAHKIYLDQYFAALHKSGDFFLLKRKSPSSDEL